MAGSNGSIFAIGDCTATQYAPTAQVASQQGSYLARIFKQMAKRDEILAEIDGLKKQAVTVAAGQEEEKKKVEEELEKKEKQLERSVKFRPFRYSHQGSLAYVVLSLLGVLPILILAV